MPRTIPPKEESFADLISSVTIDPVQIYHLFSSNAFLQTNKLFARTLGLDCATLIAELLSKENYHKAKKTDGWFYQTGKSITYNTGISYERQKTAIAKLEELGILKTEKRGPQHHIHFHLNHTAIFVYYQVLSECGLVLPKIEKIQDQVTHWIQKRRGSNSEKQPNLESQMLEFGNPKSPSFPIYNKKKSIKDPPTPRNGKSNLKVYFKKKFLQDEDFLQTWKEWEQYRRKEKHSSLTPTAIKKQANLLQDYSIDEAIEILETSMRNGWTGIFPPKNNGNGSRKPSNIIQPTRSNPHRYDRVDQVIYNN